MVQPLKIAFAGFRHGHIYDLWSRVAQRDDVVCVAACEEDPETCAQIKTAGKIPLTHERYDELLDTVSCDIVAVGDYYGKRGSMLIAALERGKHVMADKPVCTSLAEIAAIKKLAEAKTLSVGCMLDLRDTGYMRGLRSVIQSGQIGDVLAMTISGQHPLRYGTRAGWYFEPGNQGGTLNDIGIHAVDAVLWLTKLQITTIHAARQWNGHLPQVPFFNDGGQAMLSLSNGAGILVDVSYFAPDDFKGQWPQYWRFTIWGTQGVVEAQLSGDKMVLCKNGSEKPEYLPLPPGESGGYLESFLNEIRGLKPGDGASTTSSILCASTLSLQMQDCADKKSSPIPV